jgi:hypothetical protein
MRRSVVAAVAGFAALAVLVFQPTPSMLAHTAPAFHGIADDALLLMWATSHVSEQLFRNPLHLFDAGIFHPARLTLAYSDHMIGQALVGLPIWLATKNPLLEYNLLVLLSYVLGAAATFAYARELGAGRTAAAAAGLVFAFTPYRFHSPLWLQVLFTPLVPLALLAWFRFVRTRGLGAWLAWVACWTLHGLMGMYLALYFSIVMGVLVVFACVAAPPPRDRRLVAGLVAAPLAVAALLAPTLVPYAILRATPGHVRTFGLDTQLDFFWPGPGTVSAWLLGSEQLGRFGPGLVVWGLAAVGIVAARGDRSRAGLPGRFVWWVHVVGFATTLALVLVPITWQQRIPGLDMIRATNRAFYLSLFFLAVFVAEGVDRLAARSRRPRVVLAVVAMALLADMGRPPRERIRLPVEADLPEPYRWLRALPDDPVVYDQAGGPEPLARTMYFQIFHRKHMPTGYVGFWSPATNYVVHRLYRFPAPESLHLLRALDVRYVLHHASTNVAAAAAADDSEAGLTLVERAGTDLLYRVDERPQSPTIPAVPLPRDGWTIASSASGTRLRALIDGKPDTLWSVDVARGQTPSLTIDLGAAHDVAGIRCTVPLDRAAGVQWSRVELSDDGTHYATAPAGFEPDSLAALYDAPDTVRWWDARFPPRRARWVRLTNADLAFWTGEWTIGELDVLAPSSQ